MRNMTAMIPCLCGCDDGICTDYEQCLHQEGDEVG